MSPTLTLARLSPDERRELAQRIEEVQAGGQAAFSETGALLILGLWFLPLVVLVVALIWGVVRAVKASGRSSAPSAGSVAPAER